MKITIEANNDIITLHTERVQIDELAEYVRGLFVALGYSEYIVKEAMDPEWAINQYRKGLESDDD